ncbi:MAG: hypothetical protein JXR64_07170, partial [Spirochaetales bacterium]|nr:hypothetical protein [Spirochaetales bacterium]
MTISRILNNWHIKVICLILAMIFVFFTRANSLKVEPVVVFLETLTNSRYTFTQDVPKRVTLSLKGEESEIAKVPVDSLRAYIDASKINSDGEFELPVIIDQSDILLNTQKVQITVNPPTIHVTIEEKVTKYLRVESVITGIPAHGYELTGRFINPGVMSVS